MPRLQVDQQLGQDRTVALAIDEPRPNDRRREPALAVVLKDQGLGLGLRPGVRIERIRGGRDRFISAVMVPGFVHAERADMDESIELDVTGGVQEQAEGLHIELAEFCQVYPSPPPWRRS